MLPVNQSLSTELEVAEQLIDIFAEQIKNDPQDIHAFFLQQFETACAKYAQNQSAATLRDAGIYESVCAILEEEYL